MTTSTIPQGTTRSGQLRDSPPVPLVADIPALRTTVLFLVHAAGCALMLAAPLVTLAAAVTTLYLSQQLRGPLDWFMVEALIALGLFSGYISLKLFSLRPEQPRGVAVGPEQAPQLFNMLSRRTRHFRMRPSVNILLTTKAELHIVACPALAVPVVHRYYLCVGAPLTFFLGRDQFSLALAGAVAASADRQSHLAGWLTQAREDWPQILKMVENRDDIVARLLVPPLRHITRTVTRLGAPLQGDWRQQQATWLLRNSDEQKTSEYLANQIVAATFLDKQYWPMILKAAERCPTPVVKAFSHLPLLLGKTLNRTAADRWLLQAATAADRYYADVSDLLAELKLDGLHWAGLPPVNAFTVLFGSAGVLRQLDVRWQQDIEPKWRRRHTRYQRDLSRFEQLQKRAAGTGLRDESALRYIDLAPRFLNPADTLSAYRTVYATNLDDPKVCFAAGVALLGAGDSQQGCQALQRAADLDAALRQRADTLIDRYRDAWVHEDAGNDSSANRQVYA